MPTIIVPLADIITDEANPIDLTALPEAQAIAAIKDIYGFLADSVQVTIADGIATIALDDAKANQANQAQRTLARASEQAARGRYNRAIPLFQEVLRTLPDHTEARRELAMALLETGSPAAAKKHLIRVLQLDPNDAWAYLLLGNLYYQHEDDLGSADRYYISALDLAPEDPYILNSAAVVKAKRGDYTTAEQMFQQAITLDPAFPNPRHGLALCYHHLGADDEALGILEQLFAEPASDDPRHESVYAAARKLYIELIYTRATAEHETNLAALRDIFAAYTARTGLDIQLQHDPGLNTTAKVELAWRYDRDHHIIIYNARIPATHVYVLAHEFEHILLDEEARAAGRAQFYASNRAVMDKINQVLDKDLRRIRKRADLQPEAIDRFIANIIDGQINQLYNMPLDLIIDGRIHEKYPFAHDGQIISLHQEQEQNQRILTDRNLQNLTPTRILQANIALNGAQALQLDDFTHGITAHAARYRQSGMLGTAERIYAYYQDHVAHWQPGAEHDLVDLVAGELNMTDWYTWLPGSADAYVGPDPTTEDPNYLTRRDVQMPVVMYMVGALKRYAAMTPAQISQVAGEIGLLGQTGIDYTDSTQKYTLRFLPDEPFSGLQLLAIMYVGYQLLDPTLDTGLPFADAYRQAQSMYQAGM